MNYRVCLPCHGAGNTRGRLVMVRSRCLLRSSLVILLLLLSTIGCEESGGLKLDDADKSFIAAQQALKEGDTEKAMQLLTASIQARPDAWAYFDRAKLYVDTGDDEAARSDCEAGLALDPENSDLQWLQAELKKPSSQRFKGKNAEPPRTSK